MRTGAEASEFQLVHTGRRRLILEPVALRLTIATDRSVGERTQPMLTITAIIRTRQGCDQAMRDALLEVAANVRANEPDTIDFFVSQDINDPCVFTTYERFTDQAAMDRHNNSDVVARFFGIAKPILDGEVTLVTSSELFAKS
jgi:quinol monooxygenase YgiN